MGVALVLSGGDILRKWIISHSAQLNTGVVRQFSGDIVTSSYNLEELLKAVSHTGMALGMGPFSLINEAFLVEALEF